jgi:Phage integrase central domain
MPFGELAGRWLSAGIHKRASTLERVRTIIDCHLLPTLGRRPVVSVTPWDVQKLVGGWAALYAPATVWRHPGILRAIFNHAVTTDLLGLRRVAGSIFPP